MFKETQPEDLNSEEAEKSKIEKKVEILRHYLETSNDDIIIECLERNRESAEAIGFGNNATVYAVDDEFLKHLCVKEIKDKPLIKFNDPDAEFDIQDHLNNGGLKVPYAHAHVRDPKTKKEYIIMDRVMGHSIGDMIENSESLPPNFDLQSFYQKLVTSVKKMHSLGVLHRDLHKGNVMIDENGDPVIIDFGLATYNSASSNDAYVGFCQKYNSSTGRYMPVSGLFLNDENQLKLLRSELKSYIGTPRENGQ